MSTGFSICLSHSFSLSLYSYAVCICSLNFIIQSLKNALQKFLGSSEFRVSMINFEKIVKLLNFLTVSPLNTEFLGKTISIYRIIHLNGNYIKQS